MNRNAFITGAGDTNIPSMLRAMNVRVLGPSEVRGRHELRGSA